MIRTRPTIKDPLAPFEFIVTVVGGLLTVALAIGLLLVGMNATGHGQGGMSFGAFGDTEACVQVRASAVPYFYADGRPTEGVQGLRRETARSTVEELSICVKHPSFAQRLAATSAQLSGLALLVGSLFLAHRLLRQARRGRLFSRETAVRTQQLGWFLLVANVAGGFLSAIGAGVVLHAAVRGEGVFGQLGRPDISLGLVIVAAGVLTFARTLRWAVVLQEEVDATV